jgi:hypothetical protein
MFSVKKLSVALSAVVAGTLAFGMMGTGAWFTYSDQSPTHTAAAARLHVDMRNDGGYLGTNSYTFAKMAPGVWTVANPTDIAPLTTSLNVFNDGDLAVKYRLSAVYDNGDIPMFNTLVMRVYPALYGGTNPPTGTCTAAPTGAVLWQGDLSAFNDGAFVNTLPAGNSAKFCMNFALPTTAGNYYQLKTTNFHFVVDATQTDNPGWSE